MKNNKISLTAEFVSIIRSQTDPKNLYFVSARGLRLYKIIKAIISAQKLQEIFSWRLKLSNGFDKKISTNKPRQIIDLAGGYSLRGFNLCLSNSDLLYIDSDLPSVVTRKKEILEKICQQDNIDWPKNYVLLAIDVLNDSMLEKIKDLVDSNKKTLIIAEGLASYFNLKDFSLFINNIESLLNNFPAAEFYSHENISQPRGFTYTLLRSIIALLLRAPKKHSFKNAEEFKSYLISLDVKFQLDLIQKDFLFYSLSKT